MVPVLNDEIEEESLDTEDDDSPWKDFVSALYLARFQAPLFACVGFAIGYQWLIAPYSRSRGLISPLSEDALVNLTCLLLALH